MLELCLRLGRCEKKAWLKPRERQTERQIDRQRQRQRERETERETERNDLKKNVKSGGCVTRPEGMGHGPTQVCGIPGSSERPAQLFRHKGFHRLHDVYNTHVESGLKLT